MNDLFLSNMSSGRTWLAMTMHFSEPSVLRSKETHSQLFSFEWLLLVNMHKTLDNLTRNECNLSV
jgi:hypothetical protein